MADGSTTVGSVRYDASIDLAQLKSSLAAGDALVKKSYDNQAKAAKKATQTISSGTGANSGGTAAQAAALEDAWTTKTG